MIRRRRAGDIAVGALDITLRTSIEPECVESFERDPRSRFALRRDTRILEFFGIDLNSHRREHIIREAYVFGKYLLTHDVAGGCHAKDVS